MKLRTTRRHALRTFIGSSVVLLGSRLPVIGRACRDTLLTDSGPFYPDEEIPLADDLTVVPGGTGRAHGQILHLTGTVQDVDCGPLAGATVEIWQADGAGRYKHPRAGAVEALDPNFRYFAKALTGEDGTYRFKTVRPSNYTAFGIERAPHIHMRVDHPRHGALVTEVYFAGERDDAIRQRDRIFRGRGPRGRELVVPLIDGDLAPEPGSLGCRFDVIYEGPAAS